MFTAILIFGIVIAIALWANRHRHRHRFVPIHVRHYNDKSWGGQASSTAVTYRCACGKLDVRHYYGAGFLSLEEVTGESESVG